MISLKGRRLLIGRQLDGISDTLQSVLFYVAVDIMKHCMAGKAIVIC